MNCAIPKHFHWIWLGGKPLPKQMRIWQEGWKKKHPGWKATLWTEANLAPFLIKNRNYLKRCSNYAFQSDLLRFEVLYAFGGVYLDTDMECIKNIGPLIKGVTFFIGEEEKNKPGSAIIGSVAKHPLLKKIAPVLPKGEGMAGPFESAYIRKNIGSKYHSKEVKVFDRMIFFPSSWRNRPKFPFWADYAKLFPNSYAIHHWNLSWVPFHKKVERFVVNCLANFYYIIQLVFFRKVIWPFPHIRKSLSRVLPKKK